MKKNVSLSLALIQNIQYVCVSATYIHGGVELCDVLILCRKLVNLHSVTEQLVHDILLQNFQVALGHDVRLCDDGDDIHLDGLKTRIVSCWHEGGLLEQLRVTSSPCSPASSW